MYFAIFSFKPRELQENIEKNPTSNTLFKNAIIKKV